MSTLSDKILSYSPEQYIRLNTAYSLSPTNLGSGGTGAWTLTNEAPVLDATGGPQAEGGWNFNWGGNSDTSTTRYRITTTSSVTLAPEITDGSFSYGFWFKLTLTDACNNMGAANYGFSTLTSKGYSAVVSIGGTSGGAGKFANSATSSGAVQYSSTRIDDGQWHYYAFRMNETSSGVADIQTYLDGVLFTEVIGKTYTASTTAGITLGNFSASNIAADIGKLQISDVYVAPYATINATEISEIWTAGTQSGGTNVTITETPIIVTALMTEPTIVIVNYDNVEVVTSITADAYIPEPFIGAVTNALILETPATASAEILDHTTILGTGILDTPQPFTASAEILHPAFIGSGDENILETPATASALFVDPTLDIETNFYALVRSKNPSLFITDPASPLINSGFDNWGVSGTIGSQMSIVDSPGQFGAIGNRKSWRASSDGAVTTPTLRFDDAEAQTQSLYFQQTGSNTNNFTIECWYYPLTYDGTALENLISLGDTKVLVSASQISLQMNSDEIPNDGILESFTHTVNTAMTTNAWNHILITGQYGGGGLNLTSKIYLNGEIKGTRNYFHVNNTALSAGITINSNAGDLYGNFNGIALYKRVLTNSEILSNYNFVATSSPNRLIPADPFESAATLVDPDFITVSNKNFPATPITASVLNVDPSVLAAVGDGYDAELIEVSATFVDPYFYGDPDAAITATALTASADTPQNVYRLDTAYYSYVQTNIAPIRFVTFDLPNSNLDWGSDNDFAQAVPFVYDGTITASIDGMNNNSLLSTGTDYTTSGLIVKESEWDDDWGTGIGSYHSSFWIKRHPDDTGSNGLRVIESAYSHLDGSYGILYQQNNLLKMEMFNGTDYFTATSAFNVNVFDYSKHHIVVNFRKTGSNHFVDIYVDKVLAITINVGTQTLIFKNSATYWAPNTELNNKPRVSVGALIPPIASTSLPVTPTATKMYIDDFHWAATAITQTGVNNLYAAMPYRIDINWTADQFLSNNSFVVDPTIRAGVGINSAAFTASSQIVNPGLTVDFDRNVNATAITASGEAIEPFSVIGDSVSEINIVSDIFLASSQMGAAVQRTTVPAQPMNASARIPASKPAWYDPYRILIIQQSQTYAAGGTLGGIKIGDID